MDNSSDNKIHYNLGAFTVLLVDDSPTMQILYSSMLRAFGVKDVLACTDVEEAKDVIMMTQVKSKNNPDIDPIDIMTTDWIMENSSGLDLIDWVRGHKEDSIKFMPIILMSAYTTEEVVKAARDHGANEAMNKPVIGDDLAERVLAVIDKPRPFVKAPGFFGPDRRRQELPFQGEEKRKKEAEKIKAHQEETVL